MKDYVLWTKSQVKESAYYICLISQNRHTRIMWNLEEPVNRSLEESRVFWKWQTLESGVSRN